MAQPGEDVYSDLAALDYRTSQDTLASDIKDDHLAGRSSMQLENERRRVLIATGMGNDLALQGLFACPPLNQWDVSEADSFSRARFLLQHDPCDLLVINDDLYEREGGQGLAWLAGQRETPVVFLAGPSAVHFHKAYELGAHVCLPRCMALEHPPLLATVMEQALQNAQLRQSYRKAKDGLSQARQHVNRLVNMIWRSSSRPTEMQWFTQRNMLERLSEELARVERHQVPLSVAIGELKTTPEDTEEGPALPDWAMDMIAKGKRRCDVVGQYGPNGFMLLMVHTPIKGGVHCCRRLQKFLEHPQVPLPGPHIKLNAFFGVSSTATGKLSSVALLRSAEQNLEAAREDIEERIVVD